VPTASECAADLVASVRDDPAGRLALMRSRYEAERGRPELHLPYRRAALGFMGWQLRRGLLNPLDGQTPGSPWWRAVNERLLRDTAEARAHQLGLGGPPSSWSARCCVEFAERPSARRWYRAHNASIAAAYLDHRELAEAETHPERFFINLILVRALFAHALVAAPRLALGRLWPAGPVLGDPRLTFTGIFVSLGRVMPDSYPLARHLEWYVDREGGFGRLLDLGLIQPRFDALYAWSATELGIPELATLMRDGVPTYAWDPTDAGPWNPVAGRLARTVRSLLPAPGAQTDRPRHSGDDGSWSSESRHPHRGKGTRMATTTTFTIHTSLSPSDVMAVITDFGPDRARWWPNVDEAHFTLHDQGPDWAEVTEGTGLGWERERYSWDAAAGTVTIDTLASNLWAPGSGWRYELVPAADGTDLRVTLTRVPSSLKGTLIAPLIPLVGARMLGKQFQTVLRRAEGR
jgi:hypothetical protein